MDGKDDDEGLPLEKQLDRVFNEPGTPKDAVLAELSDLDRSEAEVLRSKWYAASPPRKRQVISRLVELAEENFDLNFDTVFLLAIKDQDSHVRASAATGLARSEQTNVSTPLVRLLAGDQSEEVRIAAAKALGKYILLAELGKIPEEQASRARNALLAVVDERGLSTELRRRALESISPWTSPRVTVLIEAAYHSGDPGFRASAIYAMGMNCDEKWLPMLYRELNSNDPRLRYEAARACGEIGEPEAVTHLLPLLHDTDIEVSVAAIGALGSIGGKPAKQALRSLLAEGDEKVREAIEHALEEIACYEGLISMQ